MRWSSALLSLLLLLAQVTAAEGRRGRSRPRQGTLVVKSNTEGAQVLVDGAPVGQVPLDGPLRLRPGKHTLKMTLRGYTDFLDVVTIRPGKTATMEIDLLPSAGVLNVTANVEGAQVFIDGEFVGTAPLEKEVQAGKRALRVRKPGYYEYIGTVASVAGTPQRIHVELKMLPVGTSPYRPVPPAPPKWYERWYVWAGGAAALAAIATAIVVPVVLMQKDDFRDFCDGADLCVER